MLHRVVPDRPTAFGLPSCWRIRGTAVTAAELAEHLDGVRIVDLRDLADALERGGALPDGVVLTFDDGYAEHLHIAPLLEHLEARATFFVATGLRVDTQPHAIDAWYWVADHANRGAGRIGAHEVRFDTLAGKQDLVSGHGRALLRQGGWDAVRSLAEAADIEIPAHLARDLYLACEDRAELRRLGHAIGAHSVTHPRLTELPDPRAEIFASLAETEPWFSYPDGAYDDAVVEVVRSAGARVAVTCDPGLVERGADRLRLPRIFVRSGVPSHQLPR